MFETWYQGGRAVYKTIRQLFLHIPFFSAIQDAPVSMFFLHVAVSCHPVTFALATLVELGDMVKVGIEWPDWIANFCGLGLYFLIRAWQRKRRR